MTPLVVVPARFVATGGDIRVLPGLNLFKYKPSLEH